MSRAAHSDSRRPRVRINAEEKLLSVSSMAEMTVARRSGVREILELADQDVRDLDAEIYRLQRQRQRVKRYAGKLSNLLSPISYLPNELLMRIFEDCCEDNDFELRREHVGSALILSHVCARWRTITIARPGLWSSLTIFMDQMSHSGYRVDVIEAERIVDLEREGAKLAALVEIYLDRSRNDPLTLDLAPARGPNEDCHPALELLASQSRRWKSLVYRGFCFSPSYLTCLNSLPLPMLERISFSEHEELSCNGRLYPPALDAFAVVPRISELTLHAMKVDFGVLALFSESWSMLTILSYDTTYSFCMLWKILDRCPKLRRLELGGCNRKKDDQAGSRRSSPPKTLASVSSLLVINQDICAEYDTLECLLASLTLPSLTQLTLEQIDGCTDESSTKPYSIIEDFLGRSKCPLTSLTLHAICLTDKETVTLLSRLPSLQELSIADPLTAETPYHPISKSFIESLHATKRTDIYRAAEPLITQLRSLTLRVETLDFDSLSFIETVESRWLLAQLRTSNEVGVVCLRSVELHLQEVADSEAYKPLIRLDTAGMQVVVKCEGMEGYIV